MSRAGRLAAWIVAPWLGLLAPDRSAAAADGLENWPTLTHLDIEMDLSGPPRLLGRTRATFDRVEWPTIPFLLNSALTLTAVRAADGTELSFRRTSFRPERYHREGSMWQVHLGRDPRPGGERVVLDLEYEGDGDDGSTGKDWMGILLLAPDEFRMSKQTIFHPQIPLTRDTPATQPCTARIEVIVPEAFEVYVAAADAEPRSAAPDGARVVAYELTHPGVLNLFAGLRERRSVRAGDLTVDFLVSARHLDQLDEWAGEVEGAVAFYGRILGPHSAPRLGVVEMNCRSGSYNWASQGLLMFDWRVFGNGEVPRETIAHEVAHLWFGSTVFASGVGERFLTEGLAEYCAWRYVEQARGPAASRALARAARQRYLTSVHDEGVDPSLSAVAFGVPGYDALAYAKGPLILRHAEEVLGREEFDAGLRRYVEARRGGISTLDDLLTALFDDPDVGRILLPWIEGAGHLHLARDVDVGGAAEVRWRQASCPEGIEALRPRHVTVSEIPGRSARRVGWKDGALDLTGIDPGAEALSLDPAVGLPVVGELHWVRRPVQLLASQPEDGRDDVPFDLPRIELTFDRSIAGVDEAGERMLQTGMIEAARAEEARSPYLRGVLVGADGRSVSIGLSMMDPARDYLVHLVGLETVDGVPVGPIRLRFTTAPSADQERPRIIDTEPKNGTDGVALDLPQIRIRFSEPMRPGRGYSSSLIRTLEAQGLRFPGDSLGDSRWEEDGTVLVYDLSAPLEPGTNYVMPFRNLFLDLSAHVVLDFDLRFRTADR